MRTGTKIAGFPAVPPGLTPEMASFLDAVKSRIERLETLFAQVAAEAPLQMKATEGHIYTHPAIASGTWTPLPKNGALQKIQNKGAHTILPPPQNCVIWIIMENVVGAGAVDSSNFSFANMTALDTTATHKFHLRIIVWEGFSWINATALQ